MSVNIKVTGGLNIEWGQIDPKVTGGLSGSAHMGSTSSPGHTGPLKGLEVHSASSPRHGCSLPPS